MSSGNLHAEMLLTMDARSLKKEAKVSVKNLEQLGKGGLSTSKDLTKLTGASKKTGASVKKLSVENKKLGSNFKGAVSASKQLANSFKSTARQSGLFADKQMRIGKVTRSSNKAILAQVEANNRLAKSQGRLRDANGRYIAGGAIGNGVANSKNGTGARAALNSNANKVRNAMVGGKGLIASIATFTGVAAASRTFDQAVGSLREIDRGVGTLNSLDMADTSYVVDEGMKLQKEYAGMYAADFVKAAYNIKSGIETLSDKGVADVTKAAAITAKATLGDTANMTSLFATAHGIFKEKQYADQSDGDWANMFASVISSAVKKNKTDGAKMQQAMESAGDGAITLGMEMEEFIAILGLLQKTKQAGVAGTVTKAFAANLSGAETKLNGMAKKGKNKRAVKFFDAEGRILEIEAIMASIQNRYKNSSKKQMLDELKKAFGSSEAVDFVAALIDGSKEVSKQRDYYKDVGKSGLKQADNMAQAHDKNNVDASISLKEQNRDLALLTAAQLNKDRLIKEYKAIGDEYRKIVTEMKKTGEALSSISAIYELSSVGIWDKFSPLTTVAGAVSENAIAKDKPEGVADLVLRGIDNPLNFFKDWSVYSDNLFGGKSSAETNNMLQPKLDQQKLRHAINELEAIGISSVGTLGGKVKKDYATGAILPSDFKDMIDTLKSSLQLNNVKRDLKHFTALGYKTDLTPEQKQARINEAKYAFVGAGISASQPAAKATIKAYAGGEIERSKLEEIVVALKQAIPVDKLESIYNAISMTASKEAVEPPITNIENNYDQSKDQRQNIKNYHQKNIVTVNVKSGADPEQIARTVKNAIQSKKTVHAAEPMGDTD